MNTQDMIAEKRTDLMKYVPKARRDAAARELDKLLGWVIFRAVEQTIEQTKRGGVK